MRDLLTALGTALGLVLVIEGALYALFPEGMKRAAASPASRNAGGGTKSARAAARFMPSGNNA